MSVSSHREPAVSGRAAAGAVDDQGAGRRGITALLAVIVAMSLSALSLLLIRVKLSTAGADPSFYLGYVTDLGTHIARFGQTYHGNRISYILVDAASFRLFGPIQGYFASRFLFLAVAVFCAFLLGVRFGDRWSGLVVASTLAFVPWLPRQLLWTYPDGFATVYLLVGITALLAPRGDRSRRVGEIGAGLAFALSVNANLALIAVIGLLVPSWLWLRAMDGQARPLASVVRVGGGFLAGSAVVGAVLRDLYPDGEAFPELVGLRVGLDVLGSDTWFVPFSALGIHASYLLVIPILAGMTFAVRWLEGEGSSAQPKVGTPIALYAALVAVFGLVLHFLFENTWFAAPYYTIFHLPSVVLGTAVVAGALLRRLSVRDRSVATAGIVLALGAWYALTPLPIRADLPILSLTALGPIVMLRLCARRAAVNPMLAVLVLVTPFLMFSFTHGGGPALPETLAERNELEWDIYRHSIAIKRFVETNTDVTEPVRFWHSTVGPDAEPMRLLNMVFYGTGGGRFHSEKDGSGGMPSLGPMQLESLRTEGPSVLVLMDPSSGGIRAGLVALQLAGYTIAPRAELTLSGDSFRLEVAMVEVG